MPRYRNDGSMPLNYSDSGGPWVEPGEEFEHDIPPAQRESHLRSGFISAVSNDTAGDITGRVVARRPFLLDVEGERVDDTSSAGTE